MALDKNIAGYGIVLNKGNYFFGFYATGQIEDITDSETGEVSTHYIGRNANGLEQLFPVNEYYIDKSKSINNSDNGVVKTQNILNELIEYNKKILEFNLLCARGVELASETGIVMPIAFRKNLYTLQSRLMARNEKIKESGYVENIQEGTSPNLGVYNKSLETFMNNPGIGFVISGTAAIIIVAIVILVSAAVAWKVFKALHAESKIDYKLSTDLTADLIKYLPKEVFDQLMKENEANAKKAQEALDNASGGSFLKNLKYASLGFGGFIIVDRFFLKNK